VIDQQEQARRLRAATAYTDRTDPEIAKRADVTTRTLGRWKERGFPNDINPLRIVAVAHACGVPFAWFTADYSKLDKIPASADLAFLNAAMAAYRPPPGRRS
jgi:hypothetical protein